MEHLAEENFVWLDLGPGGVFFKQKSMYSSMRRVRSGNLHTYIPVDVNEHSLAPATTLIPKKWGTSVLLQHNTFEACNPEVVLRRRNCMEMPRFVSMIGLNFSNFEPPGKGVQILKKMAGKNGKVLLTVQPLEKIGTLLTETMQFYISKYPQAAWLAKLQLGGLQPDDVKPPFIAENNCVIFEIQRLPEPNPHGFTVGEMITTHRMHRWNRTDLQILLETEFRICERIETAGSQYDAYILEPKPPAVEESQKSVQQAVSRVI